MPSMLFSDSQLIELRTLYPYLDIEPLTPQQEQLVLGLVRGLSARAAARMAGMLVSAAEEWLVTEQAAAVIGYYRGQVKTTVAVDLDRLTGMLFDAHDVAATSAERIAAIRELGQLHNLYPQKQGTTINVTNNTQNNTITVNNAKRLERMSDDELLALAQLPSLEPVATLIDGECERVEAVREETGAGHR